MYTTSCSKSLATSHDNKQNDLHIPTCMHSSSSAPDCCSASHQEMPNVKPLSKPEDFNLTNHRTDFRRLRRAARTDSNLVSGHVEGFCLRGGLKSVECLYSFCTLVRLISIISSSTQCKTAIRYQSVNMIQGHSLFNFQLASEMNGGFT